tara:strand:+ start:183 stop:1871 length:1689 start_codon:yes stop_codon:yes gene_type:complete
MQSLLSNTKNHNNLYLLIFSFFIATLFFLTGDFQEDSLITFRTARNFALHNELTYNLGASLPGSTSIIYGFICGLIYKLVGFLGEKVFFFAVVAFNSFFLVSALNKFLIQFKFFNKISNYLLITTPGFITLLHKGMETSLLAGCLLYCISIIQESIIQKKALNDFKCSIFFIICAIRIDSLLIACLIIFPYFIINFLSDLNYKKILSNFIFALSTIKFPLIFSILGFLINIILNKLFFNSYIPHTAIAKKIAYESNPNFNNFISQLKLLYLSGADENSFLLPVATKYLNFLYPFALPVFLLVVFLGIKLRREIIFKSNKFYSHNHCYYSFFTLLIFALVYPLFYCLSGMRIFPWYLWISSFAVQFFYVIFTDSFISKHSIKLFRITILSLFFLIFSAKLFLSLNDGAEENLYRASIGKYIKNISSAENVLMLEPAGYIPYYADIKTIDEVGLVSQEFTDFLSKKSPQESIVSFWIEYMPDFLVQRKHILNFRDSLGNQFSEDEILWFKNNYCLKKSFSYDPKILAPKNKFKQLILKLGSHVDYYLFVKRNKDNLCLNNLYKD